jgi:hypothetical protein
LEAPRSGVVESCPRTAGTSILPGAEDVERATGQRIETPESMPPEAADPYPRSRVTAEGQEAALLQLGCRERCDKRFGGVLFCCVVGLVWPCFVLTFKICREIFCLTSAPPKKKDC